MGKTTSKSELAAFSVCFRDVAFKPCSTHPLLFFPWSWSISDPTAEQGFAEGRKEKRRMGQLEVHGERRCGTKQEGRSIACSLPVRIHMLKSIFRPCPIALDNR